MANAFLSTRNASASTATGATEVGILKRPVDSRAVLLDALRGRRAEIEAAILARIAKDGAPTEAADPAYGEGLRAAIPAALDYCFAGIERGELNPPPLPTTLLSQARVAARNGVELDVVMGRYFAGYTVLGDFLVAGAEASGISHGPNLKRLMRLLAANFERLLAAVSDEHAREGENVQRLSHRRRVELIERLLAGEPIDVEELGYDLVGYHLGAMARGPKATDALRDLARALDRRLLLIERANDTAWAWFGGRERIDFERLRRCISSVWPSSIRLSLGEQLGGVGGWHLTHQQARAAFPIALGGVEPVIHYTDVALLAMVLRDDLLATSLRAMYLEPLQAERDGGETLCQTLRAYFATGRNISSTAATLDVKRDTVTARLGLIEERLGQSLSDRAAEVELSMHLQELETSIRSA